MFECPGTSWAICMQPARCSACSLMRGWGPPDLGGAVSGQRCPTRLGDNHTRRPFRAKSRELQPFPFAKDITNSWWRLDSVSGSGR